MSNHKVHFFKIGLAGAEEAIPGNLFSDICIEVFEQNISTKSLEHSDDVTYRLSYFVQQNDYFEGKIVKYKTDHAITGSLSDDELTDFTLGSGKRFTEVTHFIYCPATGILNFEYNHQGTFNTMFIRYINLIQAKYRAEVQMFKLMPLMHPDVLRQISDVQKIKSLTIGLPVANIPSDLDRNNLLKGLFYGSQLGHPGQISMTLSGPLGRGDRTSLISIEGLTSAISNGTIDLGLFGKVNVEVLTDFGPQIINLLENKLEASKYWSTPISNDNADRWFDDIRSFYQANLELLKISAGITDA